MIMVPNPNWLSVAGLCYDIIGATLLGKALFFNSIASISAQASTYCDENLALREALCEQRVDASFGLPMLIVGFTLQGIACFFSTNLNEWTVALLAPLGAVPLGYVTLKKSLIGTLLRKSTPSHLLAETEVAR